MEATLLASAAAAAKERRAALRVTTRTEYGGPLGGLRPVEQSPSWVVDLSDGVDAVRRRFGKNAMRNVRKAEAAGLRAREGRTEADLRAFYGVYLRTTRKHRGLPHSYRLFASARELLDPLGAFRLSLVERDGEVIAGAADFAFGGTHEAVFAGIDERHIEARPSYALHWWAIRSSIEAGLRAIDLGRATPGGTQAQFKAQWGAEPVAEYEYAPASNAETAAPAARRAVAVWHRPRAEALWAHAPFAVMSTLGQIAHRNL